MLSITTIRALDSDRLKHALKQALDRLLKQAKELPRAAKYGLLTGAGAYALLYWSRARPPRLTRAVGDDAGAATLIANRCPILTRRFWPHPLVALGGMAATITVGFQLPYASTLVTKTPYVEKLELDDGGTVALSWWRCPAGDGRGRRDVAVVFPGLNNSSETGFVRTLLTRLDAAGFLAGYGVESPAGAVCYDYRGVGAAGPLTSDRPFSADAWRDLDPVLQHIYTEAGAGARLFLLGQSLGGGILTKYLTVSHPQFVAAAVTARGGAEPDRHVSAPRAFSKTDQSCRATAWKSLQNFGITTCLKVGWALSGAPGRLADVMRATSVRDIERLVICEPWGHDSPDAYYHANDGTHDLAAVRVPLLVLAARDDNILDFSGSGPFAVTDRALVTQNPAFVAAATTCVGGHLSFLDHRGRSWADAAAVDWLRAAAKLAPAADPDVLYRYAVAPAPQDFAAAPPQLRRSSSTATPKAARAQAWPTGKGFLTGM